MCLGKKEIKPEKRQSTQLVPVSSCGRSRTCLLPLGKNEQKPDEGEIENPPNLFLSSPVDAQEPLFTLVGRQHLGQLHSHPGRGSNKNVQRQMCLISTLFKTCRSLGIWQSGILGTESAWSNQLGSLNHVYNVVDLFSLELAWHINIDSNNGSDNDHNILSI